MCPDCNILVAELIKYVKRFGEINIHDNLLNMKLQNSIEVSNSEKPLYECFDTFGIDFLLMNEDDIDNYVFQNIKKGK